jgi:precorrin-6Y C5,15-methyltransferase (decarboxylating)
LVSPERHSSHDHEGEHPRGVPTGPTSHTGPSEPGPCEPELSGPGPGWCWPRESGIGDEGWALSEEAFEHRDSMVTKPEVRALALARLAPRPGVLVWDVGAGSGSVAVECARFGAAVIAVERDPAQCARVAANARRHGAEVLVVAGVAPEALDGLPDADAVFVGGGGLAVVAAVAARRPARIVVALAAVQRTGPAMEALADAGYTVDGTLLQASRLTPLPDGAHRLAAANPVFLLWAALEHDHGQLGAP